MNQEISVDMMNAILYCITRYTIGKPKTKTELSNEGMQREGEANDFYLSDFREMYNDYDFKNANTSQTEFIVMQ